jgi:hypothetical protein
VHHDELAATPRGAQVPASSTLHRPSDPVFELAEPVMSALVPSATSCRPLGSGSGPTRHAVLHEVAQYRPVPLRGVASSVAERPCGKFVDCERRRQ